MRIEFSQLAAIVRDEMLGFSKSVPVKKVAKRFGISPEEIEMALEALQYLILHVAKTNSTDPERFANVMEQAGLKAVLATSLYVCI